jgi:PAS domain S-box-containing protein
MENDITRSGAPAPANVEGCDSVPDIAAWLSAALDEAPIAIVTMDRDHRVKSWNRAAEALFGWSADELIGQIYPLAPADLESESRTILRNCLRGEPIVWFETRRRHRDGRELHVALSAASFTGPRGEAGVVAVFSDITERVRSAREVAEQRRSLDDVEHRAHVGHWSWDAGTRLLTLSEELRRIAALGQDAAPFTDETFLERVHVDDRPRVRSRIERGLATGKTFRAVFRLLRPDGSVRLMQLIGQRAPGSQGEPARLHGNARDVTERRRLLGEVRSSRRQLRALNARLERVRSEERSAMAREVHDQLGQELTGLKMQLAAFAGRLPTDRPELRAECVPLLALVDQTLRSVRRVAATLRPPVLDSLGLEAAVEALAAAVLEPVGIRYELSLRLADLPLCPDRATAVYAIVQEALSNVVRHARARSTRVVLERQRGDLHLLVEDDGRGLGAGTVRAPSALGLIAISERTNSLGGTLRIEPRPEGGTRVRASIPWRIHGASPAS